MSVSPPQPFSRRIIRWQRTHGRHDLPWQVDASPYRVWVSEIMLQQTQVATVVGYFERFTGRFTGLSDLAAADLDEVLALWSGLGYYSRARNLHRAAIQCVEEHGGELPATLEALTNLPGIGPSTAGAILSLGFGRRGVILDGNVKRVLARHCAVSGWPGKSAVSRQLWQVADERTPERDAPAYNQGLMDLGATVCLPRKPRCEDCPVATDCRGYQAGEPENYPGRKPTRELPVRRTHMLVLRDGERVLLERRPPSGIWGGLWSLPERDGVEHPDAQALPPVRHGFTHFRLEIQPVQLPATAVDSVRDAGPQRWVGASELAGIGIPAPVRRLLERIL